MFKRLIVFLVLSLEISFITIGIALIIQTKRFKRRVSELLDEAKTEERREELKTQIDDVAKKHFKRAAWWIIGGLIINLIVFI